MNRMMHVIRSFSAAMCLTSAAIAQTPSFSSPEFWPPSQRERPAEFEKMLNAVPSRVSLRAFHDQFGSEPHIAGSPGDQRNILRLAATFRMFGMSVQVHEFWAYLAKPIDASLEIVAPEKTTLSIKEDVLPQDRFSKDPDLSIGFNAYSGSGDVTAEIIYANYGTKADFEKLKELGVDCTGKIVLARYGGNFRGYKAKFAQAAGAAGLLIYTDPDDSGYRKGVPYPEGGWANDSCIQRGSIITLDYPGDPLTPGTPATEKAERLDPEKIDLPKIPVQPIGYGAAGKIMLQMKGRALPQDLIKSWQGGLPCAYRLEGGPELKVRLMVKQERAITKTANVIGVLVGSVHPEQKVIIGCHHDAWCNGAGDPLAGTIVLYEAAKSFFQAGLSGYSPSRTLVFAAWGAEEYGIIGSTEYCEQYREDLMKNAVAYINLDAAAMGPNFGAAAAPSLKRLIEQVTRDIPLPPQVAAEGKTTVYQGWLGNEKEVSIGNLGGGSDHIGFYCHLGIPSCGLGGEGSQGTAYHSNYDNLTWYRKVVGDDYEPAIMISRVVNSLALRLAEAPLLPLDPVRYATDAKVHIESLRKRAEELKFTVDFAPLLQQFEKYETVSKDVTQRLKERLAAEKLDWPELNTINQSLLVLEREWLGPEDNSQTASRPWFRNLYAASDPDSGYAAWMLPTLRLAIEQKDPNAVQSAQDALRSVFDRLLNRMSEIETVLRQNALIPPIP